MPSVVLKKVEDPELGIDVYTLELIYDIKIEKDIVSILMTFTSPTCPFGGMLIEAIDSEIRKIKGVEVALNFVSGSGKEHMAVISAVLKMGLALRLVMPGKEEVLEL